MKKNILKYLTLATTLASAILVFCHWFLIAIPGFEVEGHSFVTIPTLLEDAAGIVTGYAGKSSAVMIIVLGGILEYLCVLSAGLSLYGIWKNCIREKKSRFIFSGQIIALGLNLLAVIAMVGANILIETIISVDNLIKPTVWLGLSILFSVGTLVSHKFYNNEL